MLLFPERFIRISSWWFIFINDYRWPRICWVWILFLSTPKELRMLVCMRSLKVVWRPRTNPCINWGVIVYRRRTEFPRGPSLTLKLVTVWFAYVSFIFLEASVFIFSLIMLLFSKLLYLFYDLPFSLMETGLFSKDCETYLKNVWSSLFLPRCFRNFLSTGVYSLCVLIIL